MILSAKSLPTKLVLHRSLAAFSLAFNFKDLPEHLSLPVSKVNASTGSFCLSIWIRTKWLGAGPLDHNKVGQLGWVLSKLCWLKESFRMGLMENMMVEGVGVDGKGCTNLKGNLRTKLSEIEEP